MCIIIVYISREITNTEIYCITDSINSSDCMRNVLVSVNGAPFMNDSIRYQYKPDPIFTRLSPMATIPA